MNSAESEPISQGLYNGSMKLARRFLRAPARVLARMRQLDDVLGYEPSQVPSGYSSTNSEANTRLHQRAREIGVTQIPGPWGFLTSGYFFGLFFMAFILNRVQNMVVPSRQPVPFQHLRSHHERRNHWQSLFRSIFPMDLSSTYSRFVFRIPSIFLLLRSLSIWTVILLHGAGVSPSSDRALVGGLHQWAAHKSMEDICWSTFISVCFALFVGSLTSGMEGLYTSSNSPFNLFGYSFTLYIYASPMTHAFKPKSGASRPDVHVLFTMVIPLLQLTLTHCLEVKQRWARQRLIPTSICSMLSLIHFHLVMWFYPASYPLPTMVPNLVESFLLLVTLTTCALNALSQLLLNGAITKPLFGHATLMPKWDEDFSVALFRLGTASLEATSVAGYGNEMGGIMRPATDWSHRQPPAEPKQSLVEVSPSGVVSIVDGTDERAGSGRTKRGFSNEIKNVKTSSRNAEVWADALVNVAWHRELVGFTVGLWKVLRGCVRYVWAFVRGRPLPLCDAALSPIVSSNSTTHQKGDAEAETDVYNRFLRGEDLGDEDDDEEFEPMVGPNSIQADEDEEYESDEDGNGDRSGEEAAELYTDLSQAATTSTAPLLLAHLTDTSSYPLTRRRYSRLVRTPDADHRSTDDDRWGAFVQERRDAKRGRIQDQHTMESRHTCVICTVEPREIICWPCRCLALCDDCRENLASRSSASKHLCPCCRSNVEGYSKIYIP